MDECLSERNGLRKWVGSVSMASMQRPAKCLGGCVNFIVLVSLTWPFFLVFRTAGGRGRRTECGGLLALDVEAFQNKGVWTREQLHHILHLVLFSNADVHIDGRRKSFCAMFAINCAI